MATETPTTQSKRLAIAAEALYLANLLVLPLFAFIVLLWLYLRHSDSVPPLAANHLGQTLNASLWAGILLVPVPLLTVLLSGTTSLSGWTAVILWFVLCHAALVLGGAVGLARAMAGKPWRFPLIGVTGRR